jgi:hypothetical protein
MSQRAKELSRRIEAFRDEVVAYVAALSDEDWNKVLDWEEWSAGVTARHIGAGHFRIFDLAQMMTAGQELPQLSMDQITEMSNKDSREHSDCTKEETLDALRINGAELAGFVAGLSDDDLDCKGSMPAFGGEFSVDQMIQFVIFQSAQEHLDNIKKTVGK